MTELKRAGRNFIAAETGTKCHEIGIYDCYYICMYTISLIKKIGKGQANKHIHPTINQPLVGNTIIQSF